MTHRAPCSIGECGRTVKTEDLPRHFDRFYCGKHWRLVPRREKRVKARHERQFARFGFYPREAAYHRLMVRVERYMTHFESD